MSKRGMMAALTLVLAAVVALPATASAAGFLPSSLVSSPGENRSQSGQPDVAASPNGNATVVWSDEINPSGLTVVHRIQSRTYFADGSVGPIRTLSADDQVAGDPHIDIDASGIATVAWERGSFSAAQVETVRLDPSGVPISGSAQPLSPSGEDTAAIGLDVNSSGVALVSWVNGTAGQAQFIRIAANDTVGTVTNLSAVAGSDAVQDGGGIAIDDQGRGFAAWSEFDGDATCCAYLVQGRAINPDDSLDPIRQLSNTAAFPQNLRSLVDSQGTGTAVWTAQDPGPPFNNIIYANRVDAAGNAGSIQIVSDDTISSFESDAAVGPDDAITVLYQEVDGSGGEHIRTRQLSSTGVLGPIRPISDGNNEAPTGLAMGATGGLATYTSQTPSDITQRATARPIDLQGAASGPEALLSADDTKDTSEEIQAAVGGDGSGFVAWARPNPDFASDYDQIEGAAFDGKPPHLDAVIPGGGTAGESLVMAATATDRAPVSLAWAFGDGSTGSGEIVQHAYGAAGTYEVTVTATDDVGNVSTAHGQVRVSAAGSPSAGTGQQAAALKKCKKIAKKKKSKRKHCIDRAKKLPV